MKQIIAHLTVKSLITVPTLALGLLVPPALVHAQYANPPSYMPMTMLNVSYDTTAHTLSTVSEASMLGAGVYPVLSLAPPGTFDPAQPWGVLNGTVFSRRLGWDDPNRRNADPSTHILNEVQAAYGSGASLWISLVSETPGLNCYLAVGQYGVNANNTTTVDPTANAYAGLFGTAGSSLNWQWDGMMDHNTYAVNQSDITVPNELFSATYKVYIGDSAGNDLVPTADTQTTWTWQGPSTIPEPSTFALLAVGVLSCLGWSRRQRSSASTSK